MINRGHYPENGNEVTEDEIAITIFIDFNSGVFQDAA